MDQEKSSPHRVEDLIARRIVAEREGQRLSRNAMLGLVRPLDPTLSYSHITRMEEAASPWTLDRFVLIAETLGLDPVDVLRDALRARGDPAEAEGEREDARGPAVTGPRAATGAGTPRRGGAEGTEGN